MPPDEIMRDLVRDLIEETKRSNKLRIELNKEVSVLNQNIVDLNETLKQIFGAITDA